MEEKACLILNNRMEEIFRRINSSFLDIQSELCGTNVALVVKTSPANVGDVGNMELIPVLGRSPGEGNGNPLQYSCLENPMHRGVWWATVHRITQSWME